MIHAMEQCMGQHLVGGTGCGQGIVHTNNSAGYGAPYTAGYGAKYGAGYGVQYGAVYGSGCSAHSGHCTV